MNAAASAGAAKQAQGQEKRAAGPKGTQGTLTTAEVALPLLTVRVTGVEHAVVELEPVVAIAAKQTPPQPKR